MVRNVKRKIQISKSLYKVLESKSAVVAELNVNVCALLLNEIYPKQIKFESSDCWVHLDATLLRKNYQNSKVNVSEQIKLLKKNGK
jgi:hypothetical protein